MESVILINYMLQVFPYMLLCLIPFRKSFRFSNIVSYLLVVGTSILVALGYTYFASNLMDKLPFNTPIATVEFVSVWISLIPIASMIFIVTKPQWQKKIFVIIFAIVCAYSTSLLTTAVYNFDELLVNVGAPIMWSDFMEISNVLSNPDNSIYIETITTSFMMLLYLYYIKFVYGNIMDSISRRDYLYLTVLSLMILMVLFVIVPPVNLFNLHNQSALYAYPEAFSLLLTFIIVIYMVFYIYFRLLVSVRDKYQIQNKVMQIEHNFQLIDTQYSNLTESIQVGKRLRHDFRYHMLALRGLLADNKLDESIDYIDAYMKEVTQYEVYNFCEVPALNMIITHYYMLCKERNIEFVANVKLPDNFNVQNADISVLIGNLLENAFKACSNSKDIDREIKLLISFAGNALAVITRNNFDGNVAFKDGRYSSTKENHTGIGLNTIKSIVEKYNGTSEFSHYDNTFICSMMLIL